MGFTQRARLPFYLTRPAFPATASVFPLANGKVKTLSSRVRKTYEGEADWMPEHWHEALRIALLHDNVNVEGERFIGRVVMEGEAYEIDWQRFMDYPTAKAEFKVQVDGYNFTNTNCVTCDQANQLDLTDDNFGEVAEGGSGGGNVFSNDQIFCDPVTASIVTYDSVYLSGPPNIDNLGAVTFNLNSPLPDVTTAKIFTYRVTCPDGSYDDADVYININGSMVGCSPPENLRDTVPPTYNFADVTWDENGSPADGWYWELYRADNLGSPVITGNSPLGFPRAQISGLESCVDYRLFVKSLCEAGVNESAFVDMTFSTDCQEASCGRYEVGYDSGTPTRTQAEVTYLDCSSQYRTVMITNTQVRLICMLQIAPGVPADTYGGYTSLEYIGPCGG